ncbi:DciA family protein [Streptomyces griseocarneus]|uniref:DciA family protein n=1 Tax=Streptomyces griseocarneus TaxID=51201 RepID=UPI00167DC088|nr:DUF721 domain-containing protein [Streptomyces griseocarneus]GHG63042.1 hypothetical protein GCM10018779_32250 [Streptomyces griseocarneus]
MSERAEKPDLARIALRRAREDAHRRRFSPAQARKIPTRRRGRTQPVALSSVVEEVLAARMPAGFLISSTVLRQWEDTVGAEMARRVRVVHFDLDSGRLTVQADSRAWATQLQLLVPMLIVRLNDHTAAQTIRTISIRGPELSRPTRLVHRPAAAGSSATSSQACDTKPTAQEMRHPEPTMSGDFEGVGDGAGESPVPTTPSTARGPHWTDSHSHEQRRSCEITQTAPVDKAVEAAAERQSRRLPREPVPTLATTERQAASADMYVRAVLRARTQRARENR